MRTWITPVLMSLLLGACASYAPSAQEQFGETVRQARAAQSAQPAPSATRPAPLDGQAAKAAVDNYQRSFEAPPKPVNVFNIGLGGNSGNP